MGRRGFSAYLRLWFRAAFAPAWDAFGWLGLLVGALLWAAHKYWPVQFIAATDALGITPEAAMSDLVWQIPITLGATVLLYRLVRAPYEMHVALVDDLDGLKTALATATQALTLARQQQPRPRVLIRYLSDGFLLPAPDAAVGHDAKQLFWVENTGDEEAVNIRFDPIRLGDWVLRCLPMDGLPKNGGRSYPRTEVSHPDDDTSIVRAHHADNWEWILREADRTEPTRGRYSVTHWDFPIVYEDPNGEQYVSHYRISLDRFTKRVSFVYLSDPNLPVR